MGAGASKVGFADLTELPPGHRQDMPVGVSFAVALNPAIISRITQGPTVEYWREYQRVNLLLDQLGEELAGFISERGYRSIPMLRRNMAWDRDSYRTVLPHKTVATRAGMGWIGKCALLITRDFGAMVRLSSVLTDAPVETARPINGSNCGNCQLCKEACPGEAVSGIPWTPQLTREEFFDAFACADTCDRLCREAGIEETICGRCIVSCPWTRRYLQKQGITL